MKIAVFCASSTTVPDSAKQLGFALGAEIAAKGHELVWGGGAISVMGEVARGARSNSGKTIGVIPELLVGVEFVDKEASEIHIVKDMRERKGLIEELSDAFVVLPGGAGTLEELFEIWVGRFLKFHNKPIVILDPFDLYKPLLELINHLEAENFVKPGMQELIFWARSVDEALNHIAGK